MTHKQIFEATLKREKIGGRVPTFELVFFLTMELIGKVHTSQRFYSQWDQMSAREKELQLQDEADSLIEPIKIFDHSALFVHPNPTDFDSVKRLLEIIREKTGDEYFLVMHGDTTLEIPTGNDMMELSMRLFEDQDGLIKEQKRRMINAFEFAEKINKHEKLLDGFALCSDYALNVNPFFPPDIFSEVIAPVLKETIDGYRERGFYTIKHSDGNLMPILDQIVQCGPDAIHSVDPQAGMDLSQCKKLYGDKVAFIGNVNCGLLQTGTDEEVVADVRRALRQGMEGGAGYVFATSNCVYTGMPLERYKLMHKIWLEEGVYAE